MRAALAGLLFLAAPLARAQDYSRLNTFATFLEYSNDSSHIILGVTPNRRLAGVGVQYERRIVASHSINLAYTAEFRPFVLESDPTDISVTTGTQTYMGVTTPVYESDTGVATRCISGTFAGSYSDPTGIYSDTIVTVVTCGRQTTIAQGGSPVGLRINLFPRRRLQLMLSSNGGYLYSTKPIPIPTAGSFNFTFNFGAGLEYYLKPHRSIRAEYLVQHYSNHYTAEQNPGVDSGFVRLAYAFGH